jgi:hypothetical protein
MVAKLRAIEAELRRRMHEPVADVGAWFQKVVNGYYCYHAVPRNIDRLSVFGQRLRRLNADYDDEPLPGKSPWCAILNRFSIFRSCLISIDKDLARQNSCHSRGCVSLSFALMRKAAPDVRRGSPHPNGLRTSPLAASRAFRPGMARTPGQARHGKRHPRKAPIGSNDLLCART